MKTISYISRIKNKVLGKKMNNDCVEYWRSRGAIIGENVDIIDSHLDGNHAFLISIGDNVTITNAMLLSHDASTKKELGFVKIGKIKIGNDVFVGAGSIILPNTRVGNKVVIGAGTIVTKDIPDNSVVAGNPCRIICTYDEYMKKNREFMKTNPVYRTWQSQKTDEERERMKMELDGIIGFDT